MNTLELSAGTIDYEDTGGDGPVVVLLHGVVMSATLWDAVIDELRGDFRCVAPTLPLGAHARPMAPDADLTLQGQARLVAEFLEKLDLHDVTLVNSDWGGSQVMVAEKVTSRVGRLVITSCEAYDNYPPGIPGKLLGLSAKLPGGLIMAFGSLKIPPLRRLPMTWGRMSKTKIPAKVMNGWFAPILRSGKIRRDFKKYANHLPSKQGLLDIADKIGEFQGDALVIWAAEDHIMPPEHGRKMAKALPNGRLVEVADSYTLIPIDQPQLLASEIRKFALNGGNG